VTSWSHRLRASLTLNSLKATRGVTRVCSLTSSRNRHVQGCPISCFYKL
jgi:hypothetical protein